MTLLARASGNLLGWSRSELQHVENACSAVRVTAYGGWNTVPFEQPMPKANVSECNNLLS
jgi:hypothetical protein